jgi:predicted nucleic acid-binding protein
LPGILVDTNVLVYQYDPSDGAKRQSAIDVVEEVRTTGTGFLSTQVLGEFFSVVTRKIPSPFSAVDAARRVENYAGSWAVCDVNLNTVLEAVRGAYTHQLSYYDALLWATARMNQITAILTEDGQHNRVIEGVRYLNPFAAEFDLAAIAGD